MREFIKKKHLIPIAVWLICFLTVFGYLELCPPQEVHLISCRLDVWIPFVPGFIYPYLSWFPYILICVWLGIRNLQEEDYIRSVLILTTGMSIFLVISCLWPTGLNLREDILYDTASLSGRLVRFVQRVDSPKSVFPSMHVYVTLVLQHTLELQKGRLSVWGIRIGRMFAVMIVLSTMFTKQHSVADAAGAAVLFLLLTAAGSFAQEKALFGHGQIKESRLE